MKNIKTEDTFILPYENYKSNGFSDADIQEYMRPRLINNGYTEEQINNYFYKQGVDAATVQQVSNRGKNQVDELGRYIAEISAINSSKDTNLGFIDAIKIGFQDSVDGMILRGKLPDELTQQEIDSLNIFERATIGISSLISDAPIYAIGGIVGATTGAGVGATAGPAGAGIGATFGSAIGAFSFQAMARQMLVDMYSRGEISSWDELALRLENIGIEGAKGAGMGAIMGGFGLAGKAIQKTALLNKAPAVIRNYTPLGMEVLGLTSGQAAIEGKVPSAEDFIVNTLMVTGLKTISSSPKTIKNINKNVQGYLYKKFILEGKTPKETAENILSDPASFQEAINDNAGLFSRKKDKLNTLLSEKKILEKRLSNFENKDIKDFYHINILKERIYNINKQLPEDLLMSKEASHIPLEKRKGFTILDKEGFDPNKAITERDIISEVVQKFNDSIGTLTLNVSKTPKNLNIFGFTNINTKELRINDSKDIRIFSHELGHVLNNATNKLWVKTFANNDTTMKELQKIASFSDTTSKQAIAEEGMAEFMTRYFLNERIAKKETPETYKVFSDMLSKSSKEVVDIIDFMKNRLQDMNKQPAIYSVSGAISFNENEPKDVLGIKGIEKFSYELKKALDDKRPLYFLESKVTGKEPEKLGSKSIYNMSRIYSGVGSIIEMFTNYNPIEFKNKKPIEKQESLKSILSPIEDIKEFATYLVAKRTLELNDRGIDVGIPVFNAKAVVQSLSKKYEIQANKFYDWHRSILKYVRDSGVISNEDYNNITRANEYFVSMRRDRTDKLGTKLNIKTNKLHYIEGSKEPIINPFESSLYIVNTLIPMAERNRIALQAAELSKYEDASKYIIRQTISEKMFNIDINDVIKVKKTLKNKNISKNVKEKNEEFLDIFEKIEDFNDSIAKNLKENEFIAFRDGRPEVYKVLDTEVATLLKSMSSINDVPNILKPFMKATQIFKAGATVFNLTFPMLNFVRDSMFAVFNSDKGVKIFLKYPEAIKSIVDKNKIYKEFLSNGGGQASFLGLDRLSLNNQIKELKDTGYTNRVWNTIKEDGVLEAINVALDPIRVLNEYIENTPRVAEFIVQTENKPRTYENLFKAAFKSRVLTIDFAKGGVYAKYINSLYAFFNANLLGAEASIKLLTDKSKAPKALAVLAILGVMEALNNYDFNNGKEEDSTSEQPEYIRNSFFTIKVPGKDYVVKFAKPRTIGFISTMMSQITTQVLNTLSNTEREDILLGLAKQGISEFVGGYSPRQLMSPTVLAPIVETWANKSIYFNTPLVPEYLMKTLPEYQYRPSTMELTKTISKTLGTIIGKENVPDILSPIKIEALVQGYTGKLGLQLLSMSDFALRKTGILKDNNTVYGDDVFNLSIVKAFVVRYPNTSSTKSLSQFYNDYSIIDKQYNSKEPVEKLRVEGIHKTLSNIRQSIAQANQTIRNINDNEQISIDEKRQSIEPLWITINALARKGVILYKNYLTSK